MATIAGTPGDIPSDELTVTYTDFKKVATLHEGSKDYALTYGVDDQRCMSEYKVAGITQQTRYYVDDYEEEIDAAGNIRKIHYLSGAIMVIENGTEHFYYTYSDYQGSLIALTDQDGNVVERYAYDPWGARRNPDDWTLADNRTSWIINRGYTGHEHLDAFGIINMNGRVYDPLTAQFFSPDPYVQDPDNWLNYNRYSYCFGNPLRYSDPTGLLTWKDIIGGFSIIVGTVLEFVPGFQTIGTGLIISGVTHFANTITGIQNSGGQLSWNQASNQAGIEFGTTMPINSPSKKETVYSSITTSSFPKVIEQEDNSAYLPSELLSVSNALEMSFKWSKDTDKENMIYHTTKGWYFEKLEGWNRKYDSQGNVVKEEYTYNSHIITVDEEKYTGGAYSLYFSKIGGKRDQIRPTNNPTSWSTMLWSMHPHPFNSPPSEPDYSFSIETGRPVYTMGWKGFNAVVIDGRAMSIRNFHLTYHRK